MFGNPLKAAANDFALLLLIIMFFGLLHCSADTVKYDPCPKSLWRIDFNNSFKQGEANLVFDIPYQERGGGLYEAIVECDGLYLINSTGHQYLRVRKDAKNIVMFGIQAPSSKDAELAEEYGKDTNHSCTFELRHETMALTRGKRAHTECQFTVRTLLNRILPNCNLERSKGLIEKIKVLKDIGQVLLEFKPSPNDVVTSDSNCETGNIFGHNRTQQLKDEMFGLNLPGLFTSTIVLEFDPACDDYNATVRQHYTHQRMEDCYYEVFALCQEGMLSIKYEKIEFDDEVMYCQPPKSKFTLAMEQLELKFRIESKPVVFLIVILITNAALYVALIPFLVAKFIQIIIRKYKQLEERLGRIYRKYKYPDGKGKKAGVVTGNDDAQLEPIYEEIPEQRSITMLPPSAIESNRSSELGMEYDDVETILLGKLSAKDLEGVVDIDPEGEEEFTPLQFEVEVDVEPVREQPLYVNIQADKELSPKVKKRRKSSLRHHSKRESSHYSHHHHHHHSHHNRHKKNTITGEGEPRAGEQGHNRISPSLTHDKQSQPTYQMGVASPAKPLPPPPSFAPPPPPLPSLSTQRAPPNVPLLIDFTDSPLEDPTPKQ